VARLSWPGWFQFLSRTHAMQVMGNKMSDHGGSGRLKFLAGGYAHRGIFRRVEHCFSVRSRMQRANHQALMVQKARCAQRGTSYASQRFPTPRPTRGG
jgi:hypothetical protein